MPTFKCPSERSSSIGSDQGELDSNIQDTSIPEPSNEQVNEPPQNLATVNPQDQTTNNSQDQATDNTQPQVPQPKLPTIRLSKRAVNNLEHIKEYAAAHGNPHDPNFTEAQERTWLHKELRKYGLRCCDATISDADQDTITTRIMKLDGLLQDLNWGGKPHSDGRYHCLHCGRIDLLAQNHFRHCKHHPLWPKVRCPVCNVKCNMFGKDPLNVHVKNHHPHMLSLLEVKIKDDKYLRGNRVPK